MKSYASPADELYASSWDTRWVNPFRSKNIPFPDSFRVDCSSFVCPVGKRLKINSEYGIRRRWMHRGIDLDLNIGDTVRAAFSGKVRIKNFERGGYGNYLVIRHPNGLETVYGHLSGFVSGRESRLFLPASPLALEDLPDALRVRTSTLRPVSWVKPSIPMKSSTLIMAPPAATST